MCVCENIEQPGVAAAYDLKEHVWEPHEIGNYHHQGQEFAPCLIASNGGQCAARDWWQHESFHLLEGGIQLNADSSYTFRLQWFSSSVD